MCVPVYIDNKRVGRFEVDVDHKQTALTFRQLSIDPELITHSGKSFEDRTVDTITFSLTRRHVELSMIFYNGSDTAEIANMLQAKGVPVYSSNLLCTEDHSRSVVVYSFRAYETTVEDLEEFFDLDQFVPE